MGGTHRIDGSGVHRPKCVFVVLAALVVVTFARGDVVSDTEARLRQHAPDIVRPTGMSFAETVERVGENRVQGWRPGSFTERLELKVFYPRVYSDPFVVESEDQRIVIQAVGASSAATSRVSGDKLLYERVYPSTDVIEIPRASGSEELLVLHDHRAPRVLEYRIIEMRGVAEVRLRDGAIEFVSSAQPEVLPGEFVPVNRGIEIARPWVIDATGARSETAAWWSIEEHTLRLTIDTEGLAFPLIIDPTFFATPALLTARSNHSVTLLQNGKILIAGGFDGTNVLASAELYDPFRSTTISLTMNSARHYHTATLLRSGKVLIAGGINTGPAVTNSAEIFDPATNTFTLTSTLAGGGAGNLILGRYGHSATLLNNGKVLLAGGGSSPYGDAPSDSMELFDPSANTFSAVPVSLSLPRAINAASLLPNGRVLISGGGNGFAALNDADIYNPGTNAITTVTMNAYRLAHTSTLLPNGKVLITGGSNSVTALNSAELFDSTTNAFTPVDATMKAARDRHRATLLTHGRVLLTGGAGLSSAEIYDPGGGTNGTFTTTESMLAPRHSHGAVMLPSGSVLVVGGDQNNGTNTAKIDSYDSEPGGVMPMPDLPSPRRRHTATQLPNGKVLIAGGEYHDGSQLVPVATALLFDPVTEAYTPLLDMTTPRTRHTATLLPNGKVLIAGGWHTAALQSAELFDPATNRFRATGNMALARVFHTATLLGSGKVLIVGGLSSAAAGELYDPAAGTFTPTPGATNGALRNHRATMLRDGRVLISGGDFDSTRIQIFEPDLGMFYVIGAMAHPRSRHSSTLLPNGRVVLAGSHLEVYAATGQLFDPVDGLLAPGSIGEKRVDHLGIVLPTGNIALIGGASTLRLYDPLTGIVIRDPPSDELPSLSAGAGTALLDGRVYLSGGYLPDGSNSTVAFLYDPEPLLQTSRRPVVNAIATRCQPTGSFNITGSGFNGGTEGSTGSFESSAANAPLLRFQRVDNQLMFYVRPNSWSNTAMNIPSLTDLAIGTYRVSVVSNGIPSLEQMVVVADTKSAATLGSYPNVTAVHGASKNNTPSAPPQYFDTTSKITAEVSAGYTGSISVNPATGTVTVGNAKPLGTYTVTVTITSLCSPPTTRTFTLTVEPISAPVITATAVSTSQVNLTWPPVAGAVRYDVYRRSAPGELEFAGSTSTTSYPDLGRTANTSYLYRVKAIDSTDAASPFSNLELATTTTFTDTSLVAGSTLIKAVHVTQVRTAVNAVRASAGLAPYSFTDASLNGEAVKSIHFQQLRTALDAARSAIGLPAASYPSSVAPGAIIAGSAISEIRNAVK